jgi:hypothetical protein
MECLLLKRPAVSGSLRVRQRVASFYQRQTVVHNQGAL